MTPDIATEEHPERIDAVEQRGSLIGSEHLGRYLWAAGLASGTVVLDAGCGTGYGLPILLDGGAARVVGVDLSEQAVADASAAASDERIEVRQADLKDLQVPDPEFGLVVCFEVIEHVDDPEGVLDELKRVLNPDGILCISTPNRGVYPAGNPHHLHEYEAQEFLATLRTRFNNVALFRQSAWIASSIDRIGAAPAAWSRPDDVTTYTIAAAGADDNERTPFVLALASDEPLPDARDQIVLGEPFEVRWWEDRVRAAGAEGAEVADRARDEVAQLQREADAARGEATAARSRSLESAARLLDSEAKIAVANARAFTLEEELEARQELIEELREEVLQARDWARSEVRSEMAETQTRIAGLEQEKLHTEGVIASMNDSLSWRVTAPLRALKRLLG